MCMFSVVVHVVYCNAVCMCACCRHRRSVERENHARCGLDHANDWMDKIANSAVDDNRQRRHVSTLILSNNLCEFVVECTSLGLASFTASQKVQFFSVNAEKNAIKAQ